MLRITGTDLEGERAPGSATKAPRRRQSWHGDAIEEVVARTAPAILRLLEDGVPRSRRAIVQSLAASHPREDVTRALIRMAVTDRLGEVEGRFTVPQGGAEG